MTDPSATPSRSALVATGQPGSSHERPPGVSLARQVVLDEDEYTAALSSIIKRDFFPSLSRLSATNTYLSALESQDSALVSASIRQLSALHETPRHRGRDREREIAGTPYVSRSVFGGGWDTPASESRREDEVGSNKRQKIDVGKGLDDFQHSYTSEDNASFLEILHEENRTRREKFSWAYEAEKRARDGRLRLEQGRRMELIEAGGHEIEDGLMPVKAIEGGPRILAIKGVAACNGSTQILAIEDGAKLDKGKGKALEDDEYTSPSTDSRAIVSASSQALIQAPTHDPTSSQLVIANTLPTASPPRPPSPTSDIHDVPLSPSLPLARALNEAGLPETAMITSGGQIIPVREVASGSEGLRRGNEVAERRDAVERQVMADEKDDREKVVPTWGYKARNALYFGPDADVSPLLPVGSTSTIETRQAPREIKHANTRMPDEDEDEGAARAGSSRRGTSPSRSAVGAAISGTPYHPSRKLPSYNNYSLVAAVPSPSPEQLGPQAVSQLMTWGTLLGTPRALGESGGELDLRPNAFNISEPKRRDAIGRRLAGDASRAMRERARGFGTAPRGLAVLSNDRPSKIGDMGPPRTPSSSFSSTPRRAADNLTPAGRDLLRRTAVTPLSASRTSSLGLPSAGSRSRGDVMERTGGWGDLGKALSSRPPAERTWTPSPAPHRVV